MYRLFNRWVHHWTSSKSESELTVCRFELSRFDKMGLCSVSVYQIEFIDSAWVYFALQLFFLTYKWNQNGRIGIATILSYELFSSLFGLVLFNFNFFLKFNWLKLFLVGCVGKEFFLTIATNQLITIWRRKCWYT